MYKEEGRMKRIKLIPITILVLALGGCVMVTNEEWVKLQQDISDLKRESQGLKKATEALKTQAEEIQKSTAADLSARIAAAEKLLSDVEKDIRKKQADTVADITSIRSDFQMLTGRFEELRYAAEKAIGEGKTGREEVESRYREAVQRLDGLQKRVSSLEQSLTVLRQEREEGREKVTEIPGIEDAYKDAYETYRKGDYKAAREKFQKYLETYPNSKYSENAQYWIGESHYSEKDYERAIIEFDDVLKKYPDGTKAPAALLKQGMAFSALGDKKSANAIFRKVIERYPKSEQAEVARKKLKE
jgi:tol-pal system protein YbgF